ncbi:MAG TPA: hypothetical protein VGK58_09755 [Lacipirellulaceae bacterium]
MNRSTWFSGCAVFALLLTPMLAAAQEAADPFGGSEEATVQDPFEGNTPPAVSSEIDRSLIATPEAQPAGAPAAENDFCQCIGEGDSPSVAKIEEALRGQLKSAGLEFTDTSLEEVVGFIQESYGISVQLDASALEEEGIDPQEPVTTQLHGISLRSALRLMLKQLGLTYIIQDEVLIITSPTEAEAQLITCVYDVRDLLHRTSGVDFDSLIDTIVSCISTKTWAENGGGEAQIRPLQPGLLVIAQTRGIHEEVRGLIETIRNVQKQPTAAADAEKSAAADADPNNLVTRPYLLSLGQPSEPEEVRSQIKHLITTALPDEKWEGRLPNGQPVLLTVLPDRIVLRHKSSVHEKVETLLSDSGVASPPPTGVARRRGGLGGAGGGFGGGGIFQPRPAPSK